jgi:hypothetical protein
MRARLSEDCGARRWSHPGQQDQGRDSCIQRCEVESDWRNRQPELTVIHGGWRTRAS